MNKNIKATGIELTPAIKSYVEEKLGMLEKFINDKNDSVSAMVEIGKTTHHHKAGEFFKAEINMSVGGQTFHAEAIEEDLYAAIDAMKDLTAEAIRKHNRRRNRLLRYGGRMFKKLTKGWRWNRK
jgi:putative sigma-54 modulation protein